MDLGGLERTLLDASDVGAACGVVVDYLAATPGAMPSVYLERGGRLRCQAVRGYRQIVDGIPLSAGVIGRSFRSGDTSVIEDVASVAEFIKIVPGVCAEVCVPVRCCGDVVGVVSVESQITLAPEQVARTETATRALGARLEQLGGGLRESRAQQLVRHGAALAGLLSVDQIVRAVLAAALDVAQMDSGAVVCTAPDGTLLAQGAAGPLAGVLERMPQEARHAVLGFVAAGSSCYTVGKHGGEDFSCLAGLRAAGAAALVLLPLDAADGDRAALVLADRCRHTISTDEVELLELLCLHASSCLRVAAMMRELHRRAATDPLTGLGHHATFQAELERAHGHAGLAVLVIDVDGFKAINDTVGHQAGDRILRETAAILSDALRGGDRLFRIGGDEFAALVRVHDSGEALDVARRLCAAATASGRVTVSIGVAPAVAGQSPQSVLARADQALYDAKQAGRNIATLSATS